MVFHITPPVMRQMCPLTNSLVHAIPVASVSSVTRIMIWTTVKNTGANPCHKGRISYEEINLLCLLQSWT